MYKFHVGGYTQIQHWICPKRIILKYIYLMDIKALLNDKNLKAKPKVEALSNWFLSNADKVDDIGCICKEQKDPIKATSIRVWSLGTKIKPEISSLLPG
ncbi:MAG: hypothetical protein IPO92_21885 [Saprospiraceae bacterium]|nr:hypothetical protein [Saprospiraceae bacterium]